MHERWGAREACLHLAEDSSSIVCDQNLAFFLLNHFVHSFGTETGSYGVGNSYGSRGKGEPYLWRRGCWRCEHPLAFRLSSSFRCFFRTFVRVRSSLSKSDVNQVNCLLVVQNLCWNERPFSFAFDGGAGKSRFLEKFLDETLVPRESSIFILSKFITFWMSAFIGEETMKIGHMRS